MSVAALRALTFPGGNEEPYCFSLAVMDFAGNLGERTDPVCLDTRDPQDPYVRAQPSERLGSGGAEGASRRAAARRSCPG